MTTHRDVACEYLSHAEGAIEHLEQLHRVPEPDRAPHAVAGAHDDKRNAMTLARIHAQLAIADELATLNAILVGRARPLGQPAPASEVGGYL